MDKYFEDSSLEDVDATLRSFAMDDSLDDVGFDEAVGFDSIEDGQVFLRHQLEILGLPSIVQLHGAPDGEKRLAAINVMYAMLTELQAKSSAVGQFQTTKRELQLENQKLERDLLSSKQKLSKALDNIETWKIKAGSAGRGTEAENRSTRNSAASWEKRAQAAEGSEKKLKSELRREQAEVERLKDALHTALGKPVGSIGRTPVAQASKPRAGNMTPRGTGDQPRTPRGGAAGMSRRRSPPSATLSLRPKSPSATPRRNGSPSATPRRTASPSGTPRRAGASPPAATPREQSIALRTEMESVKAEHSKTAAELDAARKELETYKMNAGSSQPSSDGAVPADRATPHLYVELDQLRSYRQSAEADKERTAEDHAGEVELLKLDMEAAQLSQEHELGELREFKQNHATSHHSEGSAVSSAVDGSEAEVEKLQVLQHTKLRWNGT